MLNYFLVSNGWRDTVGRRATTSPDDFTATIITTLERLTQLPQLIRAFFGDPHLRYITA